MNALSGFGALIAVVTFAIFTFRKFPDACPICIFRIIAFAAVGDVLSTVILRSGMGYGWTSEINAAVGKWGALYGNGAVLAANHFVLIGLFFLFALACRNSNFWRSLYALLAFAVGLKLWATIGWNIVQILGRIIG